MKQVGDLIEGLPEHLQVRTLLFSSKSGHVASTGNLVLYWMRTAMRTAENPALDVAKAWAAHLQLPLLVYQGLDERYEFASDRHHRFILEGARDVQAELAAQGIAYAFHLARPGKRQPSLLQLASSAAVLVTENMPVDPPRQFLQKLSVQTTTPIVVVDTACVVPMQSTQRAITRAFEFRTATEKLRKARLHQNWPESSALVHPYPLERLPQEFGLEPLDLKTADLAALVAECEIDHTVPPVTDTPGGSTAGYQRWNHFRDSGLRQYARRRNAPLADGVSRLSAYLHYGMVSPMQIAREAAGIRTEGSEKFLDELLVWRELAYHFCFHRGDHDQVTALPEWALATLRAHQSDPRPARYDWETLARGATADLLWNAAQKSLLLQGELHNNVRMTWGKALLNWTDSPERALALLIDLNHRYALDGRDPASYGGLLWCLGQFDRPFTPEQPILGTVRPRPTAEHARRLNTEDYLAKISAPRFAPVPRVAIVGAGMAGLMAARTLADQGIPVNVFEKSRGMGGRMATRRLEEWGIFDHGAPCFTAQDPRFRRYVRAWQEQGLVASWPNSPDAWVQVRGHQTAPCHSRPETFVATPQMNSICKHLASGLAIRTQTRVQSLTSKGHVFELVSDQAESLGEYEIVICTAPAEQTADLLASFPEIAEPARAISMSLCWALMAGWNTPLKLNWSAADLLESWLVFAARNHTKPGRPTDREQLVIHANSDWTGQHWEDSPELVAEEMLREFARVLGQDLPPPDVLVAHRWKFAQTLANSGPRCLTAAGDRILACGDWTTGPGVEAAFLAGSAAAGRVLNRLQPVAKAAPAVQKSLF